MFEFFLATSAWVALKYGSEKSMFCLRASVIVMPAADRSHWPALKSAPDWMPSNGVSLISCSTPSFLATRSIRSTSKPTTLSPCWNSNGLYGRPVQFTSLPALISCGFGSLPPLPDGGELDDEFEVPQPGTPMGSPGRRA